MRNTRVLTGILWVLAGVYAAATYSNMLFSLSIPIGAVLLVAVVFSLLHGAMRYRWSGIAAFIVICLVVSNILENTSILTGFPFGHYHYTDSLGPKLFLVPLLIGPAYFANGYLAAAATSEYRSRTTWGGSSPCTCSSSCSLSSFAFAVRSH